MHSGFSGVFILWRVFPFSENMAAPRGLEESRVTRDSAGGYYGVQVPKVVVEWQ